MTRDRWKRLGALCAVGALTGCAAARDVEVTGEVTAPSTVAVGDALVLDVIDVVGDGREARRVVAGRTALGGLGEFAASVVLEGDQVLVRVIDDRNGDGECSVGEAWGETHAPVEGDRVTNVSLRLGTRACPAT